MTQQNVADLVKDTRTLYISEQTGLPPEAVVEMAEAEAEADHTTVDGVLTEAEDLLALMPVDGDAFADIDGDEDGDEDEDPEDGDDE